MTPYEAVREEFDFPFELYPFQIEKVNELSQYERVGYYWQAGTGKTAGATHAALFHSETNGVNQWICPMPPILTEQWGRFLAKVKRKRDSKSPTFTIYAGTPEQRALLNLDAHFIFLSYNLMRNDAEKLVKHFRNRRVGLLLDEGHAIKNHESITHKVVKELSDGKHLMILTGTPLTTPKDAYAYVKLIAPNIYRNYRQFELLHVQELDKYDQVVAWQNQNLDLLASNMKVQTSRILRREMIKDLPAVTYPPVFYDLDPAHYKLYKRLAEERLVEFESGKEVNAISAQALRSALQQIVMNWGDFAEDERLEARGIELVHETFDELEPGSKLVVVANFVRTNRMLLEKLKKYNAVAVYGEVSASQKQEAVRRFVEDPACLCIILQPNSGGFGIDGLQHVCSDMLILEAPAVPPPFEQVVARLDRDGQTSPVRCRIGIANGTVQVRMFRQLLEKDEMVNSVQGGFKDLRELVYGH